MKIGILGYDTINIGDDIQSYVTSTLLDKIDYIILRDDYDKIYDYNTGEKIDELQETVLLIMNGWFMHSPDKTYSITNLKFPIKNNFIIPFYISSCFPEQLHELYNDACILNYKKYEPIYTRDITTMILLKNKNVNAQYFGCITQLLDGNNIKCDTLQNVTYFVDCPDSFIEEYKHQNYSHKIEIINHYDENLKFMTPKERLSFAELLLTKYKTATKIFTTRLHCFLPCRSMNLDVTYIGNFDYRTKDLVTQIPNVDELKLIFYKELKTRMI
jgi:hypothetical protein